VTLAVGMIRTVDDLLAIARAMEEHSAERYAELAEAFEVYCNADTSAVFRELAEVERRHAADFPTSQVEPPKVMPWGAEEPEIADPDHVHYLMLPWHAYDLALRHEQQAENFFAEIAARSPNPGIKVAAHSLAERERGHVAHILKRRDACSQPHAGWDEDPDPPNWDM
jgi:rubrerythrin